MLLDAEDVDTLFVLLIWATINTPAHINTLFRQVLTSKDAIAAITGYADISFHNNVFQVLNSDTAPPIEWLKSFPQTLPANDLFGVYFLLFEKPESKPIMYVGSRTSQSRGLAGRIQSHLNANISNMPSLVKVAYDTGYTLTHHGVFASCPTPQPADTPVLRLLLIALETAFTFVFWALPNRTTHYGLPDKSILPWDISTRRETRRET